MVLDGKSSQEYPVNAGVIYADDTTLYSKCDRASDLWEQVDLTSELVSIYETLWTGVGSGLLISMLGKLSCFVCINVEKRCFDIASTSDTDVVSTLCNAKNPTSDFVSFSTSHQRYFNVDPQR